MVVLFAISAAAQEPTDLREFRLGDPVQALPPSGYTGFACANAPAEVLSSWMDYAKCPRDERGLHAVSFRYDPAANFIGQVNNTYEGTRVAGQPVLLSLLIADSGIVEGIRIATDPSARLYLRKKAFLFGLQARQRYGEEGWNCDELAPATDEQPVGGVFVKEHCQKTTTTRRLIIDRELYRRAGQKLEDFIGRSQVLILRAE
jgi:hypothetical protein